MQEEKFNGYCSQCNQGKYYDYQENNQFNGNDYEEDEQVQEFDYNNEKKFNNQKKCNCEYERPEYIKPRPCHCNPPKIERPKCCRPCCCCCCNQCKR